VAGTTMGVDAEAAGTVRAEEGSSFSRRKRKSREEEDLSQF